MSLQARLDRLDRAFRRGPGHVSPSPGPTTRDTILAIDTVIQRLEEHVEYHEQNPGSIEVPDLDRYGETLSQHMKRVNDMCAEHDRISEEWRRANRPDLPPRGDSEIDKRIAALTAEIERVEEEIRAANNVGGGGSG